MPEADVRGVEEPHRLDTPLGPLDDEDGVAHTGPGTGGERPLPHEGAPAEATLTDQAMPLSAPQDAPAEEEPEEEMELDDDLDIS